VEQKICIHCFVSGHVQGVWYRASTQKQAELFGLTGWACNLPDGRVEVVACGEKEKVLQLYEWLKKGPERAKVAEVTYEEILWIEHERFGVK
jgi:acylphosphatase